MVVVWLTWAEDGKSCPVNVHDILGVDHESVVPNAHALVRTQHCSLFVRETPHEIQDKLAQAKTQSKT